MDLFSSVLISSSYVWVWVRIEAIIHSLKMIRMMLKKSNWFVLSAQVAFKMSAGALTLVVAEAKCLVRRRRLPLWER